MDSQNLKKAFFESESGEEIQRCIQCGTCSSSCPMTDAMDYGPRSLFALIRDADMEAVIHSNSPWMCVSCYQCTSRCPQEIPVTELMYGLKRLITQSRENTRSNRAKDLHRSFSTSLKLFGRITESFIMAKYSLKHPLTGISSVPLAVRMARKRRVGITVHRVDNPFRFRRSFKQLR